MNRVFKALSDPTRRAVLQLLREGPKNAGDLADHFPVSKATMSAHFSVLREAGLIDAEKQGTTVTYHLQLSVLEEALFGLADSVGLGFSAQARPQQVKPLSETASRIRMPRTDRIMACGLMGLMLAADLAAFVLFKDRGPNLWFGVSIMPGTLALIWLCFAGSIALVFNRPSIRGTREAQVGTAFFGKTLVVVGVTLTVAHLALLAFFGGLVGPDRNDLILRAFFCAMGLNLAFMFNAMPKIMDPKRMRVAGNPRLIGRVGVVCSLLMAGVGLVGEPGKIGPLFLTLAFTPPVFIVFSILTTPRCKPG